MFFEIIFFFLSRSFHGYTIEKNNKNRAVCKSKIEITIRDQHMNGRQKEQDLWKIRQNENVFVLKKQQKKKKFFSFESFAFSILRVSFRMISVNVI